MLSIAVFAVGAVLIIVAIVLVGDAAQKGFERRASEGGSSFGLTLLLIALVAMPVAVLLVTWVRGLLLEAIRH